MHSAAINGHPNMKRCHYNSPNAPEKDRVSMRAVTQQFTSIRLAIDKSAREEFQWMNKLTDVDRRAGLHKAALKR